MKEKKIIIILTSLISVWVWRQKLFVIAMMIGGLLVAPEASEILCHYCFGDGDSLILDSSYIKKSPVVFSVAKDMKVGSEIKHVKLNQRQDWRLSYAINGVTIKRTKKGFVMQQWIEFDTTGKVPTELNMGVMKIKVQDAIVHTFDCKPFWAICEFKSLK